MWRCRFEKPQEKNDDGRRHAFWNFLKAVRVAHPLGARNFDWDFKDAEIAEFEGLKALFGGARERNLRGGPRGKRQRKPRPPPNYTLAIEDGAVEPAVETPVAAEDVADGHGATASDSDDAPLVERRFSMVQRSRRTQKAPAATPLVFGQPREPRAPKRRASALAAPQAVPAAASQAFPSRSDDAAWGEFTPQCVDDGLRCLDRVWNSGKGGQCTSARKDDAKHCKLHQKSNSLADVNELIPAAKLKEFQKAAKDAFFSTNASGGGLGKTRAGGERAVATSSLKLN